MFPRVRSGASLYRRSKGTQAGNAKGPSRDREGPLASSHRYLIVIFVTLESVKLANPALNWKPG